jgi:hypothetical protein
MPSLLAAHDRVWAVEWGRARRTLERGSFSHFARVATRLGAATCGGPAAVVECRSTSQQMTRPDPSSHLVLSRRHLHTGSRRRPLEQG